MLVGWSWATFVSVQLALQILMIVFYLIFRHNTGIFKYNTSNISNMERPTDEERRVLEFLLNNALELEANLVKKGERIMSEVERVRMTIKRYEALLDR